MGTKMRFPSLQLSLLSCYPMQGLRFIEIDEQNDWRHCTYKCLEEVTLEDVNNPLDGVSQLPVLRIIQFRPIFFQERESSLRVQETSTKKFVTLSQDLRGEHVRPYRYSVTEVAFQQQSNMRQCMVTMFLLGYASSVQLKCADEWQSAQRKISYLH